jgi:hypothetical protein
MYSKAFKDVCDWAKKNSHVLTWAVIYGGCDRLYAGIWKKLSNVKWDYGIYEAFEGPEGRVPVKMSENPTLRLSFLTRSPAGEQLAVYRSHPNPDVLLPEPPRAPRIDK